MTMTFTKNKTISGSDVVAWNVDKDGVPFGQIWTYKAKSGYTFRYHAKLVTQLYLGDFDNLKDAKKAMMTA